MQRFARLREEPALGEFPSFFFVVQHELPSDLDQGLPQRCPLSFGPVGAAPQRRFVLRLGQARLTCGPVVVASLPVLDEGISEQRFPQSHRPLRSSVRAPPGWPDLPGDCRCRAHLLAAQPVCSMRTVHRSGHAVCDAPASPSVLA